MSPATGSLRAWSSIHREPTATRIEFGGYLDAGQLETIRAAFRDALVEPAAPRLIIDVRLVPFIDGAAIACMAAGADKARDVGVHPAVMAVGDVKRSFEQVGLHDLID